MTTPDPTLTAIEQRLANQYAHEKTALEQDDLAYLLRRLKAAEEVIKRAKEMRGWTENPDAQYNCTGCVGDQDNDTVDCPGHPGLLDACSLFDEALTTWQEARRDG